MVESGKSPNSILLFRVTAQDSRCLPRLEEAFIADDAIVVISRTS